MVKETTNTISMTREELYKEVWSTPMRTLAKKYGLSDQGLGKKCKKHKIPKPPVGYWQKLEHGKKPVKPPLPKEDAQELQEIVFYKKAIEDKNKGGPDARQPRFYFRLLHRWSISGIRMGWRDERPPFFHRG